MSLAPCRVHMSSRLGVVCKVSFKTYAGFIICKIHFMGQNPARRLLCTSLLYECFARFEGGLGIWESCRVDLLHSGATGHKEGRRSSRGQGSLPSPQDPTCPQCPGGARPRIDVASPPTNN